MYCRPRLFSSSIIRLAFLIELTGCCISFTGPIPSASQEVLSRASFRQSSCSLLMARSSKPQSPKEPTESTNEVWIGVNRGQRTEFKMCQQCNRPMNRRARWKDDATWAAVKYCSDKCRGEAKRRAPTDGIE